MRVAVINVPLRKDGVAGGRWITVPPDGYGGIQWVVSTIIDGLLALDVETILLGAPGSDARSGLTVVDAGEPDQIRAWLRTHSDRFDVIHDHSVGAVFETERPGKPYVGTWHLTGSARLPENPIYLSSAQRSLAKAHSAPVIPIAVNPARYPLWEAKQDYLLFMGRVSPWKGALEAAHFARNAGRELVIAGPCWDRAYRDKIEDRYGGSVSFVGEVGGLERLQLIQRAAAVMVLSQPVAGPWGGLWSEPGATIVSEAACCGTPVIASENGCLAELVPGVGALLPEHQIPSGAACRELLGLLPSPSDVHRRAVERWHHLRLAVRYVEQYTNACCGSVW